MQATSDYVAPTGEIGHLIFELEWDWHARAHDESHNDWDWWRVQEYQPTCGRCEGNNLPQVWSIGGADFLFAVCEQCGFAYQFEWR